MSARATWKHGWKVSFRSGAVYFGIVFAAGFLFGSIRVILVVPRLGVRAAELLEAPLMLLATVVAARFVVRRFVLPRSIVPRLATGLVALGLLLLAELGTVLTLQRQTISVYIASRDPVAGSAYIALLLLFAVMPALLATRWAARLGL